MKIFSQALDSLIAIIQWCQDRTMNATFIDNMNLMKLPIVLQQEILNGPNITIIIAIAIIIIFFFSQYVFIQERGKKKRDLDWRKWDSTWNKESTEPSVSPTQLTFLSTSFWGKQGREKGKKILTYIPPKLSASVFWIKLEGYSLQKTIYWPVWPIKLGMLLVYVSRNLLSTYHALIALRVQLNCIYDSIRSPILHYVSTPDAHDVRNRHHNHR